MATSKDMDTLSNAKRGPDALASESRIRKVAKTDAAAGPSSSEKMLLGIETEQPLLLEETVDTDNSGETNNNGTSDSTTPNKKSRGAGQKRGRSWNREEEVLLMDAWNKVAEKGLKAKDVANEVETEFHSMAVKKWGADKQATNNAQDRKGGSLLARAKGLIRQFSDIVTFARTNTKAVNFPRGLTSEELEKVFQEINVKRQSDGHEVFRSWHVRDALIYHQEHFLKNSGSVGSSDSSAKHQKRKSYPQESIPRSGFDVERQKLELDKQRFKEAQRVATLDSLHKLLSTLSADDETIPIIREQILKLTTITF